MESDIDLTVPLADRDSTFLIRFQFFLRQCMLDSILFDDGFIDESASHGLDHILTATAKHVRIYGRLLDVGVPLDSNVSSR